MLGNTGEGKETGKWMEVERGPDRDVDRAHGESEAAQGLVTLVATREVSLCPAQRGILCGQSSQLP